MTTPSQSITRVSISDLPESQSVKDEDFLLLQSDGISSKIQLSNIVLDRQNISFYNEIADLNRATAENSQSIQQLKEIVDVQASTSTGSATPTTQVTQSRIDQIETSTADLQTKTNTLTTDVQTNKKRVESVNVSLGNRIALLQKDISDTKSDLSGIAEQNVKTSTDYTSGINLRVTSLESRVAALENSITNVNTLIRQLETRLESIN